MRLAQARTAEETMQHAFSINHGILGERQIGSDEARTAEETMQHAFSINHGILGNVERRNVGERRGT